MIKEEKEVINKGNKESKEGIKKRLLFPSLNLINGKECK